MGKKDTAYNIKDRLPVNSGNYMCVPTQIVEPPTDSRVFSLVVAEKESGAENYTT